MPGGTRGEPLWRNTVGCVRQEVVPDVARGRPPLRIDVEEVLNVARRVADESGGDISTRVRHRAAPRVIDIGAEVAREPLVERCLPRMERGPLRTVPVNALR